MPYYYYGFDPTYFLVIIGAVICMIASARVKSTYNKYSQYRSASGMTGAQAAQRILNSAGIYDVTIQHVSGNLTDHYNPSAKTLLYTIPHRLQPLELQHMSVDMQSSIRTAIFH